MFNISYILTTTMFFLFSFKTINVILIWEYLPRKSWSSPNYWYYYSSTSLNANVFRVDTNGYLNNYNVHSTTPGVRPISFYNSYTKLRQSTAELGYKIFP